MNPEDFGRAFVALFVIIDPVGNLLVFHILTEHLDRGQKGAAIGVAIAASAVLLGGFGLGGAGVLGLLGISEPSFRVAAGLLLLPMAYDLVVVGELPQARTRESLDPVQLGLVPLAVPLLERRSSSQATSAAVG